MTGEGKCIDGPDEPSIRQVGPGFTISPGTQVVLKVRKALATGEEYRKAGSVGIVVESHPAEDLPYVVQFADGSTVQATADELALRRREVEDELANVEVDLRPHIIYRCQVGSKAYGLAVEDSDDDLRGIYLPPARLHWSLYRLPEQPDRRSVNELLIELRVGAKDRSLGLT